MFYNNKIILVSGSLTITYLKMDKSDRLQRRGEPSHIAKLNVLYDTFSLDSFIFCPALCH